MPVRSKKKFIIIQIDGLGYSLLQKLRKTRYMSFLSKVLRSYHISKFDPGYPTTTPFVQAGIMYNDNGNIPGFQFLDKKGQKAYAMSLPQSARSIEEELSKRNYGILRGGTSIGNIFCGDAERSILTVAHLYKTESGAKNLRDILFLVLLNPVATSKVVFSSIVEFFVELYETYTEVVSAFVHWRDFNWPFFYPYFPFFRTFINATAREISTEAALLEMDRNSPYIYVTYGGYDWISHYRGPESLSSFTVLRQIDSDVKKLYKRARQKGYDVYVLSDHGQVPSVPFERLYYESLDSYVAEISKLPTKGFHAHDSERSSRMKFVYHKLKYYYENFSFPLRVVSSAFIKYMARVFRKEEKHDPKIDWRNRKQIMIFYSSSLAHMYFNDSPHRLDISDIEKRYPDFIYRLVQHPGIGFVIGKQGSAIEVISAKGRVIIRGKDVKHIGERFLHLYGDEAKLLKQIQYFAQLKYAGDLIVNGAYNGEYIVAFEGFHFGSHDSIGGKQNDAFFISKQKHELGHILNAKELYHIFIAYHTLKTSGKGL